MMFGMKTTQKNITIFVKSKLASDAKWAVKALVRIFQENQTASEQATETTKEDNGIGFTGTDGNFLSSLAKQQLARGSLSEKQMVFVFKRMPKYHKQVIAFSDKDALMKMVAAAYPTMQDDYEAACETEEAIRNEERAHGRD